MPITNPTGLTVSGFFKWILIVFSLPSFYGAYQGLIKQKTTVGRWKIVEGAEAIQQGWQDLGIALVLLILAWAVWFFFERYED